LRFGRRQSPAGPARQARRGTRGCGGRARAPCAAGREREPWNAALHLARRGAGRTRVCTELPRLASGLVDQPGGKAVTPVVLAMPGNERAADELARVIGAERGSATIRRFPDGESYVRIESSVQDRRVLVVCTLDRPDAKLVPLLLL